MSFLDTCSGQRNDELDVLLCCVLVCGQIVVYHLLQSVNIVELTV